MKVYVRLFKPLIGWLIAFIGFVILLIPMVIIGIAIRIESPGSCIFKQKRIGQNGKRFNLYKFRTMRSDTPSDVPTHLLHGSQSFITPLGAFLRKSSLDELPQLVNVLKRDMNLIGPRPALWNQYDLEEARKANGSDQLKPGITGWAQVRGRDEIPVELKAAYDGEYAQKVSFLLDAKIVFMTFSTVLFGKGFKEGADD